MSAYSEWKYGLITDSEYNAICRREEAEDQYQDDDDWYEEEEVFEDDDIEDY